MRRETFVRRELSGSESSGGALVAGSSGSSRDERFGCVRAGLRLPLRPHPTRQQPALFSLCVQSTPKIKCLAFPSARTSSIAKNNQQRLPRSPLAGSRGRSPVSEGQATWRSEEPKQWFREQWQVTPPSCHRGSGLFIWRFFPRGLGPADAGSDHIPGRTHEDPVANDTGRYPKKQCVASSGLSTLHA